MKALRRADAMHLEAAEGWLELGNGLQANEELEKISPVFRVHPDVLEVRWSVYAKAKRFNMCLEIAETLTVQVPRRAKSWLLLASTLHSMQKTEMACGTLLGVSDQFARHPAFSYDLACYLCCLGQMEDALRRLGAAFRIDSSNELKLRALEEKMLAPLWKRIGDLRPQ
jgi:hypothetical protein